MKAAAAAIKDKLTGSKPPSKNNKKKRTQDDDGGTTAADGGGGKARMKKAPKGDAKDSNKEKKAGQGDGSKEPKGAAKRKTEEPTAPAPQPTAEPGADGGRPLVRKKDSKYQASKYQVDKKDQKEQQTCMMNATEPETDKEKKKEEPPKEEKKEAKDDNFGFKPKDPNDKIIDPEYEKRNTEGRDPEAMNAEQAGNLRAFITQYEAMGVKNILNEFETIKIYNRTPFDTQAHDANPTKNRYKDIFCLDATRVILKDGKDGGEYIHANRCENPLFMNKFITTQGPIEPTVGDFWRLVVQENVGYIIMLCSVVELGKKKCEQYYPETKEESITYAGDIVVTLKDKFEDAHFINSKFTLESPGKPKRYLYHHYWKNWPDRGVPLTALAGIRLLRHARASTFSTIVHCSAGVGRTGTLIAVEWLFQTLCTKAPPYDLKQMLFEMRNMRAHAIQTAPQYVYIVFVIFRLLAMKDSSFHPVFHKFSHDIQTHTGVKIDGGAVPGAPAAGPTAPTGAAGAAPPTGP